MKRLLALVLSLLFLGTLVSVPASASPSTDWPAYLFSARHSSRSGATAITPSNVATLHKAWMFTAPGPTMPGQPGGGFIASPIVSNGRVYIGSNTGVFYALDEATGQVIWSHFIGFVGRHTCGARGVTSSATVALDPVTMAPTVYVAGGDGFLYALDGATGAEVWHGTIGIPSSTVNDYYDWSSPAVVNGKVFIGISSQCDSPLVRGGLRSFDQHTGATLATWYTVASGFIGGSIWSSPAASAKSVWVTTGNADSGTPGDWNSIVRLDPATLTVKARWMVPAAESVIDSDFGGSPTLFAAAGVSMVGACNKNGVYYAWRSFDLVRQWRFNVAVGSEEGVRACLSAAAWNGSGLFIAGPTTTIGGTSFNGSIRRLDPVTGQAMWETGLGGAVLGSAAVNSGGVVAVPMYDQQGGTNGVELVSTATGAQLRYLSSKQVFAQPTFAGTYLFVAAQGGALTAWTV
jgi:outer membrane protein assembly factor BamB